MTTGLDYMLQGDIFGAVLQSFNVAGIGMPIFYASILVFLAVIMWIKTESIESISLVFIFGGIAVMQMVEPTMRLYFGLVIFFGIGILVYQTVWRPK